VTPPHGLYSPRDAASAARDAEFSDGTSTRVKLVAGEGRNSSPHLAMA